MAISTKQFTSKLQGTSAASLTIQTNNGSVTYEPFGDDTYIDVRNGTSSIVSIEDTSTSYVSTIYWIRYRGMMPIAKYGEEYYTFAGGSASHTSTGALTGAYWFIGADSEGNSLYMTVDDSGVTFSADAPMNLLTYNVSEPRTTLAAEFVASGVTHTSIVYQTSQQTLYFSLSGSKTNSNGSTTYYLSAADGSTNYTMTLDYDTEPVVESVSGSNGIVYHAYDGGSSELDGLSFSDSDILSTCLDEIEAGVLPYILVSSAPVETRGKTTTEIAIPLEKRIEYYTYSTQSSTHKLYGEASGYSATVNSSGITIAAVETSGITEANAPLHISGSTIYMDPVGASPLSRISTPPLDLLATSASVCIGGGYGNNWCSIDCHAFTLPNYFALTESDLFEYILTQSQTAISTHYLAIFEADTDNKLLHLVALSNNNASNDSSVGFKKVGVSYISQEYNTIKPAKLYYAAHIADQTAATVAGYSANTFNLNPISSSTPLGMYKANVCSTTDGDIDYNDILELDYSTFGMTSERHFVGLIHND